MNSSTTPAGAAGGLLQLPALNNTFGALVIGTYVALIQYGWMLYQGYHYYSLYNNDVLTLKLLVALVLALQTFHTFLGMHATYYYLVSNFFNPIALQTAVWSINSMGVTTGATIFLSQLFFLRRVYKLGRNFIPIVILVGLLLLSELGLAIAVTVDIFVSSTLHNSTQSWMNSAGVGICSLADSILTATTDSIIDVLTVYAINTGMLTLIVNTLSFILALKMPNNLIYVAIDFIATKLYANTLLAVLLSRRYLAEQTPGGIVQSTSIDLGSTRGMRFTYNHHINDDGITVDAKRAATSSETHPSFFQDGGSKFNHTM
ncbi:uncharacterized protein BXZ73DRAFT_99846 [Epithele typhae]|uniref:uncharacterized protein n=1 Tax=Epithele typhae TaxID=378194 RepID=UPI002007D8DB|nr:uncharacterized protein BXZ73DRAFT_99846 [Epithele typhae]KAH9938785.1 hypothetical protein BXZ73DRAFT_99846 [Epithele typhae]